MDLSAKDIETAKFTFSIYDFDGNGTMDAYYLGPALRALNLTPSLAAIYNLGGTKRKGEKSLSIEEFLALYSEAKKSKDSGTIDDFMECLRSSDKEGDGNISSDQLGHILQAYGERLDPDEVAEIIRECGNVQEGLIAYAPFVKHLMDGPDSVPVKPRGFNSTPKTDAEPPNVIVNAATGGEDETPTVKPVENTSAAYTVKVPKTKRSSVIDDTTAPPLSPVTSAAFTLKTPKRSPSCTEDDKKAAAEAAEKALMPKKQMAMIAMKTKGLIGNIVK